MLVMNVLTLMPGGLVRLGQRYYLENFYRSWEQHDKSSNWQLVGAKETYLYPIILLYLVVDDYTWMCHFHMPVYFLARAESLTTYLTSVSSTSWVPCNTDPPLHCVVLQQHLHPCLQLVFHVWLLRFLASDYLWQVHWLVPGATRLSPPWGLAWYWTLHLLEVGSGLLSKRRKFHCIVVISDLV